MKMTINGLREFHNSIGRKCRMKRSAGYHYDGGRVRIIYGYQAEAHNGEMKYYFTTRLADEQRCGTVLPVEDIEFIDDEVEI